MLPSRDRFLGYYLVGDPKKIEKHYIRENKVKDFWIHKYNA